MLSTHKAQVAITDLIIALVIFLILLAVVLGTWNIYTTRYAEEMSYRNLELTAFQATQLLVSQQGMPTAWENLDLENPDDLAQLQVLGIASSPMVLDPDKVNALFLSLDAGAIAERLNIERYKFYLEFTNLDNVALIEGKGDNPGLTPDAVHELVKLRRIVRYKNALVFFYFSLWSEQ